MNKEELYRQIIMDHYNNPQNKVSEAPDGYIIQKGLNPSCGDELEMYLLLDGDSIKDIKFKGEGCSICCSATSVMTNEVKGLSKEDAKKKIDNFEKILKGEEYDEEIFEDAVAYSGISKFPARYKCAFLSWQTLKDIFEIEG